MKKSELRQMIREEIGGTKIENGYTGPITIEYYEGSYQFNTDVYNNISIDEALKIAMQQLRRQKIYRKTDQTLWATFSIKVDGKWKEDFDRRLKLK